MLIKDRHFAQQTTPSVTRHDLVEARCLICGSEMAFLFSAPAHEEWFELYWCHECDFGRLAGDFPQDRVATFYSDDYYTHSVKQKDDRSPSLSERALIHAAWLLDNGRHFSPTEVPQGKTFCDIGCGNGADMRLFREAGYETSGIEPDPLARRQAKVHGSVYAGVAEDLPSIGPFDVVSLMHSLEHCSDPVKAIEGVKQLLADDGTLVIEVPNSTALAFRWFKERWPWTDIPRHLSFFTETSLRRLLERCGLKVTQVRYVGFTRQFLPEWRNKVGSKFSGWPLLMSSGLLRDALKFDSIRIHAART
ncbi:class I SAM-dependent methyltransferase [Bradyrhizobium sp. BTAi1]|jgi:SAM-dependent methyltransferase|uniref:class I SAM-dependent methyltransferase n=1 Tax=Bradyrhizobium sp. (strain BTAi1 / ATCC BAA-1182) TaxID=288000 RepID=UPI00005E00BC|nr:class I SAM-dependent methyltransferase [Bradyrhizobium sp. BTAi1]ABQ35980.1 hypothetical protein BBta_3910 [Bradyrhizobium sp. BTAi1]